MNRPTFSTFALLSLLALTACAILCAAESKPNELTDAEKKDGWKLLFDGTTTKGWHAIGKKEFPDKGWTVEAGALKHAAKGGGGDIATDEAYENFEFTLEWNIAAGGNSGIKYRVADTAGAAFGPEFQICDDGKNPDSVKNSKHSAGTIYDLMPPLPTKVVKPAGEWQTARLLVQGNHVEHWMNGAKSAEYEFNSEEWKTAVAASKFKGNAKYATPAKNFIALQDHGDEVMYRSIKIRELPAK